MRLGPYRRVLADRRVRQVLLLGTLIRIPLFASFIALTLHVVTTLHRSYGYAGFLEAAATVCLAISAPWRGRLLDRAGLRRVVAPAVVLQVVCWSAAPFVSYWPLLVLAAVSNLFAVPTFTVIRQAMIAAVGEDDRRTVLALDSSAVEVSFMAGPLVGAWAATTFPTSWALFGLAMATAAAGLALWLVNPAMRHEQAQAAASSTGRRLLMAPFLLLCAAAAATTLVLGGTDLALVAALRHLGATKALGVIEALWGVGSFTGGLAYGALRRPISTYALLAGLAALTAPLAWAPSVWTLGLLVILAGLLCAPTITASVDQISALVPISSRGEALGWQGSAMTTGQAAGTPLVGLAIDRRGPGAGFLLAAGVGALVAGIGALGAHRRPAARAGAADDADDVLARQTR